MTAPLDSGAPTLGRLPDPREKPWLTVAELAAITGEGEKVIRAALDAGQLPLLEVGRYKRIPTAALLRMLDIAPADAPDREAGSATEPATASVVALTKAFGGTHHAPDRSA